MKLLIACTLAGISLAGFGSCAEYSEMAARFPLVDLSEKTAEQEVLEKDFAADGEAWVAPKEVSWALTGKGQRFVTLPDGRLCVVFADAAEGSPTKGDLVAWVGQKENSRCLDSTGTFRLLLLRDHGKGADGCRSLKMSSDGTLVATTKLRYRPGDKDDSLVSVRFRCPEKVTASAEDSYRRRLAHASEWYLPSRLGVFYHWGLFTDREKGRFRYNTPAEFEAAAADPEQIGRNMADLAKGMGAKYAVLTLWHTNARHMMLFPTRETSFVNRTTKDYIGPYLRACRAAGLKGLLYFPTDSSTWDADPQHPTIDPRVGPPGTIAFVDCVGRVLDELKERYGDLIDGFWLDGGFPGLTCTFPSKIHSLWPKAIVIGNNHVRMTIPDVDICTTEVCPRWPTQPDYCRPDGYRLTNAFRMPPPPDDLNEDVPTMGEWEWAGLAGLKKPFVEDPNRLVKMIVCSLGQRGRWNCCVGIGPLIDGTGAEPVRKAVDAMGRFVAWAGEAVYGTKGPAGTFFGAGNLYGYGFKGFCSVTQSLSDPNVFYAIVTEAEYTGDNLVLFATNGHTPRRISDLRTGRTYSFATYQSTEVSGVDWSDVKTYGATVLKFEF